MGLTTVREALEFSAALRLPTTTTAEQRKAMVDEVTRRVVLGSAPFLKQDCCNVNVCWLQALELLELSSVENTLVGDVDYLGLSPSQLKRLTIGIELVTNPSVLLADGTSESVSKALRGPRTPHVCRCWVNSVVEIRANHWT
jgi:ABC-type multidrug transport system ATPase subunit